MGNLFFGTMIIRLIEKSRQHGKMDNVSRKVEMLKYKTLTE
jgi:hypothetical protein